MGTLVWVEVRGPEGDAVCRAVRRERDRQVDEAER